jgi:Carboxypeptidase regulatory-like domain
MNIGPMRLVENVTAAITNDLGEYRLFWLPPDDYIVMAIPIRGTIEDNLIRTDGNGYTINARVSPSAGNLIIAPSEIPPLPFFYRDGNEPANAARISIKAAENLRGIDVTIRPPVTYAIRGKLLNLPMINPAIPAAGTPFNRLEIEVEPRAEPAVRFRNSIPNGLVKVNPDKSTFEIRGVLPGEYWVSARFAGKEARTPVDVAGKDVEDVAISFVTGFDVPIKISMEGQPQGAGFDRLLDSLRVGLGPTDGPGDVQAEQVPGEAPGTLVARNVPPGEYRLAWSIIGTPPVYFKSVLVEGIAAQASFRLDRPPLRPIEVVWGLATGVITGTVTNSRLEPASDVTVVALSPTRGSKYATSGPDGRFRITALPPGDFRVFAWEAITLYSWQNPDVMQRDWSKGVDVHLDDGSTATVNVTSIPPPITPGK